ncbi:MAG: CotH kinase family protein [Eubacteriales bacterium]
MKIRFSVLGLALLLALSALLSACQPKSTTTDEPTGSTTTTAPGTTTTPPATTTTTPPATTTTTPPATTTTTPGTSGTTTAEEEQVEVTVLINEVCAANETLHIAPDGEYQDWIELYNPTDAPVDLAGYGLSDDPTDPYAYRFPGGTLLPGEHLMVYAVGQVIQVPGVHYAPFKITSKGETLYLTRPDGLLADALTIPALLTDITYGRSADGGEVLARLRGTPGSTNAGSLLQLSGLSVSFSAQSGFYELPFYLTLTVPEGGRVYYTTDCTDPTQSSTRYTEPLLIEDASQHPNHFSQIVVAGGMHYPRDLIDKATIIRAVVYDGEGNVSDIVTRTYFVGFDEKDGYDDMMVLSIAADPAQFYNSTTGIFVNGNWSQRGREAERQASLSCFDTDGTLLFTQEAGVRIHGSSTRAYQQKSLTLYAREEYDGNNRFLNTLFDDVGSLKSIMLRSDAGRDFKEGILQGLVYDRSILVSPYKPCVVFLEGEYYGIYDLYVKTSEHAIEDKYGVEKDDVAIIKKGKLDEGTKADEDDYKRLVSYVSNNDMADPVHYAQVCQWMDIQSYIDFVAAQIYYCNVDWSMGQNILCWRANTVDPENPYADGKWRWCLYDLDFCVGKTNSTYHAGVNAFTVVMPYTRIAAFGPQNTLIYNLIQNPDFSRRFVLTFLDMGNVNFHPDRVTPILQAALDAYAPNIENHFERFDAYASDGTKRDEVMFRQRTEYLTTYFETRFDYAADHLKQQFHLTGTLTDITLSTNLPAGGTVRLNTVTPDLSTGSYELRYYSDYALTATAIAAEGYRFVGWEVGGITLEQGTAHTPTLHFTLTDGEPCVLRALFEAVE